ncbi:hypothetical protein C0993_010914, partial [Termitomyces sp. T159_Od127]
MNGWMDLTDPLDDTLVFNQTNLEEMMQLKGGSIWAGYLTRRPTLPNGKRNTRHPRALPIQGQRDNLSLPDWPRRILRHRPHIQVASVALDEAEGIGITHMFAPMLDLSRELRWGRVKEHFGEDPFLMGEMGHAFVQGMQSGRRRNASATALARVVATCKHFAAFGSPQGRLWVLSISLARGQNANGTLAVYAGTVSVDSMDATVQSILRVEFALGLFEGTSPCLSMQRARGPEWAVIDPYPYEDYFGSIRTTKSSDILCAADAESIVLLENRANTLPLSTGVRSVSLIGPQADRVTFSDYVFLNASKRGITLLEGFRQLLANVSSETKINFALGSELWSDDEAGIPAAVDAARNSDVAVAMVGTWSLNQTNLWLPGTNATTGKHVDLSELGLVGAQLALVQAVREAGKPTVVVVGSQLRSRGSRR